MAYRTDISPRDRSGAIAAVAGIHILLLLAFLNLSGKMPLAIPDDPMSIIDIGQAPPPPPPPPPSLQQRQPKPKEREGGSAPKNIRSQATPVVAPKPRIDTPTVQEIAASETPRQGAAATQGASDVRGPGTGAGGAGTGTGNGSGGNGPGGGGGGGVASSPRLATPVLRGRDFTPEMLSEWPPGATIFLRLRVDERGLVSECLVDRGTGLRSIDSQVCNIAHDRLRFRPAMSRSGQAVAGWFGYAQPAPR